MHSETPACVFTTNTHTFFVSLALSVLLSRNLSLSFFSSLSRIFSLYLCMNSQTSHVCSYRRIHIHKHKHTYTRTHFFVFLSRALSLTVSPCISLFLSVFFLSPYLSLSLSLPQTSVSLSHNDANTLQHTATYCNTLQHTARQRRHLC